MEVKFNGGYFVWTKAGRRPRYRHETREDAVKEAKRLARLNPDQKFIVQQFLETVLFEQVPRSNGGQAEKEPAMNKTIWYGSKDNNVRFSEDKSVLVTQGINNPQCFTTSGELDGLELIGPTAHQTQQQSGAVA